MTDIRAAVTEHAKQLDIVTRSAYAEALRRAAETVAHDLAVLTELADLFDPRSDEPEM